MKTTTLIRSCGVAGILAGPLKLFATVFHPEETSAAWASIHLVGYTGMALALLALVGIAFWQAERFGRLGLAGFLITFLALASMLTEGREHTFHPQLIHGTTPVALPHLIITSLLFSVGGIMLGIAIARAGVLPRAAGIVLAVGAPIYAFAPPIGIPAVFIGSTLLVYGAVTWLSYALWISAAVDARAAGADGEAAAP